VKPEKLSKGEIKRVVGYSSTYACKTSKIFDFWCREMKRTKTLSFCTFQIKDSKVSLTFSFAAAKKLSKLKILTHLENRRFSNASFFACLF
jgi:hypothetical protein